MVSLRIVCCHGVLACTLLGPHDIIDVHCVSNACITVFPTCRLFVPGKEADHMNAGLGNEISCMMHSILAAADASSFVRWVCVMLLLVCFAWAAVSYRKILVTSFVCFLSAY